MALDAALVEDWRDVLRKRRCRLAVGRERGRGQGEQRRSGEGAK